MADEDTLRIVLEEEGRGGAPPGPPPPIPSAPPPTWSYHAPAPTRAAPVLSPPALPTPIGPPPVPPRPPGRAVVPAGPDPGGLPSVVSSGVPAVPARAGSAVGPLSWPSGLVVPVRIVAPIPVPVTGLAAAVPSASSLPSITPAALG